MSTHRPVALTAYTPPPLRPSSPDHNRTSAMPFSRPRRAYEIARDRLLFRTAKNIRHKTSDGATKSVNGENNFTMQADNKVHPLAMPQPLDFGVTTESPSREASQAVRLGENGFGDNQAAPTWGWPGIGTWPEYSNPIREADPAVHAGEMKLKDQPENTWGWPGLGTWPGFSMQGETRSQTPASQRRTDGLGLRKPWDKASKDSSGET